MDRRRKKKDQRQIEIVLFIHIIPEFNFDQSINMKMNLIDLDIDQFYHLEYFYLSKLTSK